MYPPRILVTGSRSWTDPWLIASALNRAAEKLGGQAVLVHGACPKGADAIAAQLWVDAGRPDEAHPAKWGEHDDACPEWHLSQNRCKRAGFRRNAEMVALGADLCLAFIHGGSNGATMTARIAAQAGVETWLIELGQGETPHCFPDYGVHSAPHRGCILR